MVNEQQRIESLGPAERIISVLTAYKDHLYHNRSGVVSPSTAPGGKHWEPASWKLNANGEKEVFRHILTGTKTVKHMIGIMGADNKVTGTHYEYREAGLFPEVVAYVYQQVATVWQSDNEFAARWASWAANQDNRDMKCVLAAFMLIQNRAGLPVKNEQGETVMRDEDFRAVGEAIILSRDFNPKMIRRVGAILRLPEVIAINQKLGFNKTSVRYNKAVTKWLHHIETVPKILNGLVEKGSFSNDIQELVRMVGYKPITKAFFKALRWKQRQSKAGHRSIGLDLVIENNSWNGKTEEEICEIISTGKVGFKGVLGRIPPDIGLTKAVMAASIGAGLLSPADLIIYTPTLESLGLLQIPEIGRMWSDAVAAADNRRAANIALRVVTTEAKDKLNAGADAALNKAVSKVVNQRSMRIYMCIDISSSMSHAIKRAKAVATLLVKAFPIDKLHIATFNTVGRVIEIKDNSATGVAQAFRGITASGGTTHVAALRALSKFKAQPDEDVLIMFVGDQEEAWVSQFKDFFTEFNPVALAMLDVSKAPNTWAARPYASWVVHAANSLRVPCIPVDEKVFADPYASVQAIRDLIASVPVGATPMPTFKFKKSLIEVILEVPLLKRPVWADVYNSVAA